MRQNTPKVTNRAERMTHVQGRLRLFRDPV
jgi:hypothetical protein